MLAVLWFRARPFGRGARRVGEGWKGRAGCRVGGYALSSSADAKPARVQTIIDQRDKQFIPYVTALQVGTSVWFANTDKIRHHVYSFSPAKKFELPLYAGVPAEPVVFDRPGFVTLGCNIHDWMIAYVAVLTTPYFAVTHAEGRARLNKSPARSISRGGLASRA